MSHRSNSLRALGVAFMLMMQAACGDDGGGSTAPERPVVMQVRVTPAERELQVGQTVAVAAVPLAADGTELQGRAVTWRSDAADVATVSASGVVEARRVGSATIVATVEGKEGRAAITIVVTPVASVQLDATSLALVEWQSQPVTATARDAAGNPLPDRPIVWSTENPAIATVSADGVVEAVAVGTTRIVAASGDRSAAAQVTVSPAVVASVELEPASFELTEGGARQLTARARDANGRVLEGRTVQWLTTDARVARVEANGTVTAVRWGSAFVSARIGGQISSTRVIVTSPLAYDFIYDARTGSQNQPQLYRLDVRAPGATPVRILEFAGASEVTPSPDGRRIAFTGTDVHGTEIFVANRDGSNIVALTSGPSSADQPTWSPDGSRIAFRRWPAGGPPGPFNNADVWVMNADGSDQVNLTAEAGDAGSMESPTWSPRQADGSYRIAYSRQVLVDGYMRGRIYSMRADGADKRALTADGGQLDTDPAWSPDGQSIVFVRTGGEAMGDLWIMGATGSAARQLMAQDPAFEQRSPTWSPDGRFIAFTSNHELGENNRWDYQIYTVTADGSTIVRRTEGHEKLNPTWIVRP